MNRAKPVVLAALAVVVTALAGCGGSGGGDASSSTTANATDNGTPTKGGKITVLSDAGYTGSWPSGLDPATNTNGAANQSYMNSIYGQLFKLTDGGKVEPDLASGSKLSADARTFTITLRDGVTFSDGSKFDAATVVWNMQRALKSPCTCKPLWPIDAGGVKATGPMEVTLSFKAPYAAALNSFIDANVNWIASRTAYEKMGAQAFKLKPVGAGPFTVVSNTPSSQIVFQRNPTYYRKDRPYLDGLTFKSIGSDQAAYQALQAGQAQAYEDMSTPALVAQAKSKFQVTQQLSTSPYVIQLNTKKPPFDDKAARDAIYYATDSETIRSKLFDDMYPASQSFTAEGGLFHSPKIPGYKAYDLAKAKALVKQLGGLTVDLGTINVLVAKQTTQALQTQWAQAGIKTTIHSYDLAPLIAQFQQNTWQAMLQTAGSWDPAAGIGPTFRFGSASPFSGVKDPTLDKLLGQAGAVPDDAKRKELYAEAGKRISDESYAPFMFAFAPANVAVKGVQGPGLTTALPAIVVTPPVLWEDVSTADKT